MKRTQFISKKKQSGLVEVPRRKSLAGKTEEESALAGDIVASLDEQCFSILEYLPVEKNRIRYRGNDFYIKSFVQHGDVVKIEAQAKVWHKPVIHGDVNEAK